MNSNKDILDRAIGRPAMMAFMILVGTYVTVSYTHLTLPTTPYV